METWVPLVEEQVLMVHDQTSATQMQGRVSFLYRVFRADSVRDLDQQEFTYLGAEIYFDEQGKIYRYEEPVFDFDGFHAFVKDKYDHYQIDEFVLVTREGQFNIRYFPLTEYSPEEHTQLVDNIELVGFRMFPDLLPIGADLLLSVLDKDPMGDVEGNIVTFERILGLIVGDENSFLKIQVLMNLTELYLLNGDLDNSSNIFSMVPRSVTPEIEKQLTHCRQIRFENDEFLGKIVLSYDRGSISFWRAILLYTGLELDRGSKIIGHLEDAKEHWEEIETHSRDLFKTCFNLGQAYTAFNPQSNSAELIYGKVISQYQELVDKTIEDTNMVIDAYIGILDFENARHYISTILSSSPSVHNRIFTLIKKGELEIPEFPNSALSSLTEALDLLDTTTSTDYDYIGLFSSIINLAYLTKNPNITEIITKHPQFMNNNNSARWKHFVEYVTLIIEIMKHPFNESVDILLYYLNNEIKKAQDRKVMINHILRIFYRELVYNKEDYIPDMRIINLISDIVIDHGDDEIRGISEIVTKLVEENKSALIYDTVKDLEDLYPGNFILTRSRADLSLPTLIDMLYIRKMIQTGVVEIYN